MSDPSLSGRVALVTGASSGVGQAIAERLLASGMRVGLCGRRSERLEALAAQSEPTRSCQLPGNLRDEAYALSLVPRVEAALGPLDVLINAAGMGRREPLCSGSTQAWRETWEVNVLALSVVTREAVRSMLQRAAGGHILHVSSLAGHRVTPGTGMYSASKFAVRALTEALRQELRELGSAIRVSSVSPGYVETEFHVSYFGNPEEAQALYRKYRVLSAGDVADAVLYALSAPPHVAVHDLLLRSHEQPV